MPITQARPPRRSRNSSVTRCIIVVTAFVFLIGLIALITWLVIDPKKLEYSLESGSITGFNISGNHLITADINYVLRATNPNRHISVYYDRIEATTSFQDQLLSINDVHPFHQPKRNVTHLDMDLAARNIGLYGAVAQDLKLGRAAGRIDLNVKIHAKIRLKVGVFKIHRHVWIDCGPVTTPFSPSQGFVRVFCSSSYDD